MTTTKQNKLERTIQELEKKIEPARPNMKPEAEMIYSNRKTGTVVYKVLTDNSTLPYEVPEHIVWGHFLAGNQKGYAESGCYVASEANFSIGKVKEDEKKVIIPREGTETTYFDIQVKVGDIEFYKSKFKPYSKEKK